MGARGRGGYHRRGARDDGRRDAIAPSNFAFSASSAWDPSVEEIYKTCSGADDGPWRQAEVLQGSRVQLQNGLTCTKQRPTSVPATPEQYRCPAFHPLQVGKGRWKTTETVVGVGIELTGAPNESGQKR